MPRSTVGRILARHRMPLLAHLDQATGLAVRRPRPVRYERARPGELIHLDIKKLGRIPDGGGHRKLGRTAGHRNNKKRGRGYALLHHAIDDNTRLAYSKIHTDERKNTVIGFWRRARAFFADAGIEVRSVMTDNGRAYRSKDFASALGTLDHLRTRPYRPQTNGRWRGSNAPSPPSGPTPTPTAQTRPAQRPTPAGSTSTITTDPTPASAAKPPQPAFTTSRGTTSSASTAPDLPESV